MILKNYQKRVLDDLSGYLAALEKTKNLKDAFRQHWQERGVAIGFHGMQPYNNLLAGVPHVCLKVPTGGGKTLLGCASLRRIFDSMGITKTKAVVWLVPSTSILDQTARALSSVEHPYRQWLDYDFGSRVEIYNSEQAKNGQNLTPSTVREQLSVFVMSYDSLRIKKKEGRKAYQENGALAQFVPHFTQPDALLPDVDESALIQVLGQMNPVVVVDESHNATSELSVEMLKNLNPSFVLDLTATPRQNSNIISIVDAREMKLENMVKLPVIVYNRHTKQDVLTDAIQLRGSIERQAKAAEANGGQYIRPIVLFQAQPKGKEASATFEKLKAALIDMGIPKEEIAIKTSEVNELKNVELMSRTCPIRYIITVNALKEGWDCPFAYILATLANRTSQVDVEQIVGRILRLPYTEKHGQPLLNMSYVLTCSNDFSATVQNVIKGLNRAGFSDKEFRVGSEAEPEPEKPEETQTQQSIDDIQTGPEEEFLDFDFAAARQRLEKSAGDVMSPAVQDMTQTAEQTGAAFEAEMNDLDDLPLMGGGEMRRHIQMQAEFAEEAQALRLPMFVEQIEESLFSEAMKRPVASQALIDGFTLADKDTQINFNMTQGDVAKVDVDSDERPRRIALSEREARQFKTYMESIPSEKRKDACINIIHGQLNRLDCVGSGDLKRYIQRVVDQMNADQLAEMEGSIQAYARKIRDKIEALMADYKEKRFYDMINTKEITCEPNFRFPKVISPVETMPPISKSLYTDEASVNGLEEKVILAVAGLENVKWWHRNIERQGFYLNGFINHYPDFIVMTKKGNIVVIETKGDDRDNSDSRAKLALGKKWEALAEGNRYSYFMVFDENDTGLDGAMTVAAFMGIMKRL